MASQIVIVDYGMGNLGSVANALERLGVPFTVSSHPAALEAARGIILPGVGAFPAAMRNIRESGLFDALERQVVEKKKPFLGICLGMQLVAEDSTEGEYAKGFGWIPGHVVKIESTDLPIPHVGWNSVERATENPFFCSLSPQADFYFDHSFHFRCAPQWVVAHCSYGGDLVAAVQKENILAVQFHPEKSQRNGLKFLRHFATHVEEVARG